MITFRFYVVSTVAFFLALAVGIVIGSALDEQIVEGLQGRVERVENDLDNTLETIDSKDSTIDQLEQYVGESAPFTVEDRIAGTELLVVAESGVDAGAVERLVARGRQGGASIEGIVWLEPAWELDDDAEIEQLLELVTTEADTPEVVRTDVWTDVLAEVSTELGLTFPPPGLPDGTEDTTTTTVGTDLVTTTTTSTTTPTDGGGDTGGSVAVLDGPLVDDLTESSFLRLEAVDSGDIGPVLVDRLAVVFVTGPDSDFADPGRITTELASRQTSLGIPTVVASVYVERDDGPDRGDLLEPIRGDEALAMEVSTVDDLDLVAGRVATILALADAGDGLVGHYGYGSDADAVLPPWPGP